MDAEVTVYRCFTNIKSILGLSVAGWFANWATWGLSAGAGAVRGKHDGVAYAWDGHPDRTAGGFIGGGAAMLGVGVVGIGVSRVLAVTKILQCDVNVDINNCVTRGFRGYFAGIQVSSALVAAGLGVMVYGIVYRKCGHCGGGVPMNTARRRSSIARISRSSSCTCRCTGPASP